MVSPRERENLCVAQPYKHYFNTVVIVKFRDSWRVVFHKSGCISCAANSPILWAGFRRNVQNTNFAYSTDSDTVDRRRKQDIRTSDRCELGDAHSTPTSTAANSQLLGSESSISLTYPVQNCWQKLQFHESFSVATKNGSPNFF